MMRRHPRHHDHIADPEAGRERHLVGDEVGALRNPGHAHARLVQVRPLEALLQQRHRTRIVVDRYPERLGDAVGGDVVMGRPDAAGGEDVGIALPQRIERGDDILLDIRHHPDLAQIDADRGQVFGDVADILVLGPTGQDFIADNQNRGGDRRVIVRFTHRH